MDWKKTTIGIVFFLSPFFASAATFTLDPIQSQYTEGDTITITPTGISQCGIVTFNPAFGPSSGQYPSYLISQGDQVWTPCDDTPFIWTPPIGTIGALIWSPDNTHPDTDPVSIIQEATWGWTDPTALGFQDPFFPAFTVVAASTSTDPNAGIIAAISQASASSTEAVAGGQLFFFSIFLIIAIFWTIYAIFVLWR